MADASFYKNYPNRKDHRKPCRDARRHTRGCRNNGPCKYCESTRTHFDRRARIVADEKLREEGY